MTEFKDDVGSPQRTTLPYCADPGGALQSEALRWAEHTKHWLYCVRFGVVICGIFLL